MATTDILPFCTATPGAANCLTPSAYAALTSILADGFVAGTALSIQINTVLRQSSFMAAGVANWLVSQGISVPDDGNLTNLVTEINNGIINAISTEISLVPGIFGPGQTPQARSSPLLSTVYVNTGTKTIFVSVTVGSASTGSGSGIMAVTANAGATSGSMSQVDVSNTIIGTGAGEGAKVGFFVPPGWSYSVTASNSEGSGTTIQNWVEYK